MSPWITGVVMTVLTGVVILGGIKSIARVCERLVPFMAIFYVVGCVDPAGHALRHDPRHARPHLLERLHAARRRSAASSAPA